MTQNYWSFIYKWVITVISENVNCLAPEPFLENVGSINSLFHYYSIYQTLERYQVLSYLPVKEVAYLQIFIKSINDKETLSWTTFLYPFSTMLWIMLVFTATIIATFLTFFERHFGLSDKSSLVLEYLRNLWNALKANFGGEPGYEYENVILKTISFGCLLAGVIIWGAYQASLTSELSVIKLKLPFIDPETLYRSDFRLVFTKKYYGLPNKRTTPNKRKYPQKTTPFFPK